MKIAIISTGSELLRGVIPDTNATWMAAQLDARGYAVDRILVVDDDLDKLSASLRQMFGEYDLVMVGGGLGPTVDDITAAAAAEALSLPLERRKEAVAEIQSRFERIGKEMAAVNLKQADLPAGCTIIENELGTAPGFAVRTPKGWAVFLPGVSKEMKPMFQKHVTGGENPYLPPIQGSSIRSVLRCFGRGESDVQTALNPVMETFPKLTWSFRATFPELVLTLSGEDADTVQTAKKETLSILSRNVFADRDIDLPTALGQTLNNKSLTLATAESCTGGQIGHQITETPGSSAYFRGGVIAYDNEIKCDVLKVSRSVLDAHGAVSEEVVTAMAQGVTRILGADVGIAVSGIAGPTGGTVDRPVGLVHFAVVHPRGIVHRQKVFHGYNRSGVKRISAWTGMWLAHCAIRED